MKKNVAVLGVCINLVFQEKCVKTIMQSNTILSVDVTVSVKNHYGKQILANPHGCAHSNFIVFQTLGYN